MKKSVLFDRCARCSGRAEYQAQTNNPVEPVKLCGECLSNAMVANQVDLWEHLDARSSRVQVGCGLIGLSLAGLAGWIYIGQFFLGRCS
jgi:hypothetical protein